MDRKQFIKSCGMACLGVSGLATLLQSCDSSKQITGTIEDSNMLVPLSAFETTKNNSSVYKKYVVVQNEQLQFPICIFRLNENTYSALLMKCSHQGAELQVFGDKLQCPAHGSEFDSLGNVQTSPANTRLRSFPVTIQANNLSISLK